MYDIINNGGHGTGTVEGTQAEAYDIDELLFFDAPLANCTAFYADGQGEDESEDKDTTDPDGDVPEDAMGITAAKKKKVSKRTMGYTPKEDVCLPDLGLQLAKMPFPAPSKRARPIGRG
jgi:hypothetical protein